MAKYLLIAAALLSLATAGLGYKNYVTLTETKENLKSTGDTLVTRTKQLADTRGELTKTTATLTSTTADRDKLTADLAAKESELSTTNGKLKEATDAGTAKDAQITSLTADLEKAKTDLANATGGSGGGPVVEDPRIAELNALVASLQEKIKATDSQMAVFREKEDRRTKGLLIKGTEGRVLAVNPAWNFVVLSIGDKQGAVNNAELLLKRGGQYLGKVRITSVEPSTSIADIVANTLPEGVAVQPGDSVIFQSSNN